MKVNGEVILIQLDRRRTQKLDAQFESESEWSGHWSADEYRQKKKKKKYAKPKKSYENSNDSAISRQTESSSTNTDDGRKYKKKNKIDRDGLPQQKSKRKGDCDDDYSSNRDSDRMISSYSNTCDNSTTARYSDKSGSISIDNKHKQKKKQKKRMKKKKHCKRRSSGSEEVMDVDEKNRRYGHERDDYKHRNKGKRQSSKDGDRKERDRYSRTSRDAYVTSGDDEDGSESEYKNHGRKRRKEKENTRYKYKDRRDKKGRRKHDRYGNRGRGGRKSDTTKVTRKETTNRSNLSNRGESDNKYHQFRGNNYIYYPSVDNNTNGYKNEHGCDKSRSVGAFNCKFWR